VPLDEYKTQVLLLHSEQSTLDSLSSGFGDRYTVHCATSGSEALNTLGDTPINVIVTAQKLPGMSGIEALREAKKRSPETIGILLAEDEDKGLEAMVGDKEVFQIVRGNITSDAISELVDDATQQMRLMALANSANDAAADVDETSAEHIVMETSENGSTIISDGTGRMPALDPTKISAASAVGSHSVDLLVLTKDDEFLDTIKESSRGTHGVHYASTLAQADQIIRKQNVGVAVVDAAMVGEKIEQLTAHLRKGAPRLVSIVAGRRDDGEMMMDLINRSKVYRFLLKPVSPGRARLAVEASVKHHLEAPDAAFKMKGSASKPAATPPKPQAPPAAKAQPKAVPPESKAKVEPKAAVVDDEPKGSTGTFATDPPLGSNKMPKGESPNDDALSSAFGDDDSSFTETVTGLFATVSKKFSSDGNDDELPKPAPTRDESVPAIDHEPEVASSGGALFQDPKILGIGAAAIVVVAGILFWLIGGSDEAVDSAAPVADTPVVAESERDTAAEDSDTAAAVPDVEQQITQAIADAESALLESRVDDASAALELLGRVAPDNERLPFLTAQLAQIQLRSYLIDARTAIRESRFEDATNALAAARSLDLPDSTEITAAELELAAAQEAQQAEDVLALASARLEDGDLLEPANDNARYYFQLALSGDPDNVAAKQGLSVIASKLAMQARTATDNGNLDQAEALLAESNGLDPDNTELSAAITALADKRAEIAAAQREAEAEARRRAEAERRAAEARAAAELEAEQERAAAAAAAAAAPVEQAATVAEDQPPIEAASLADEQPVANTDENTDGGTAADAQAAPAEATVAPVAAASQVTTSVRDLNRIKYVAPKYPRAAQRRNLSGWVDVVFTVDTTGLVKNVDIRDSEPGETFVAAATRAVERWEFEPVVENGQVVEKRVGVRMMFALE
jgi:TonB family protein